MKLALCGKAGSGKSTLAKLLIDEHGYVRLAFADKLKKLAGEILGCPIDKTKPEHRQFLQELGSIARKVDPQVWIKHLDRQLQQENQVVQVERGLYTFMPTGRCKFVVDDCRYLNEAEYLRSQGFMLVTVRGRGFDLGELGKHGSETEIDEIQPDFYLDNSGDIADTYQRLKDFMIIWLDAEHRQRIEQ